MDIQGSNLPVLDDVYSLTDAQIAAFRASGHVLTRQVLRRAEVAAYREHIVSAADRYNTEKRELADRDTYGKAFLQIMNLWRMDDRVRLFVLAKRFGRIAARLLGVENVRIYHDQALFKEPGGGPTPWHQDQYYWPIDTTNTLTMWMPLVDITVDMGMLTFASGSHRAGSVLAREISDESQQEFEDYVRGHALEISRADTMQAGDATWHYGYTIHQAPGNLSAIRREVITIIYVADGARVTEPVNRYQEDDRRVWLGGRPAGHLVDAEVNPLVL